MSLLLAINIIFTMLFGMNQDEFIYLTKTVEAEAGICDHMEKIAVTKVIIARVESDEFPNTVIDVIQQKGQFQVYANLRLFKVKVSNHTTKAVIKALTSSRRDYGTYFCNYDIANNKEWFDTLNVIYEGEYMTYYEER